MPEAPHQDDRKLIPIWIREENARRQLPEPRRAISLEVEEQLRGLATEPAGGAQQRPELETRARKLLATGVPPVEASTGRVKLPTQFEREQAIMRVRQGLGSGRSLLGPNAMQVRDDIFAPRRQGESDLGSGLNDREGNPDVNRVEPWSIWAYVTSQSGGSTDWSSLYWRYRIWVPSSFPACDASWFLNVTPRAVLTGRYDLFAMNFFGVATAEVVLRFWTGTWHWRSVRPSASSECLSSASHQSTGGDALGERARRASKSSADLRTNARRARALARFRGSVRHTAEEPCVAGSSPALGTESVS